MPAFETVLNELKDLKSEKIIDFCNTAYKWYESLSSQNEAATDKILEFLNKNTATKQHEVYEGISRLQQNMSKSNLPATEKRRMEILTRDMSYAYNKFANEKVISDITEVIKKLTYSERDIKNPENKTTVQKAIEELTFQKNDFSGRIRESRMTSNESDRATLRHSTVNNSKKILNQAYLKISEEKSLKSIIEWCIEKVSEHINVPKMIQDFSRTSHLAIKEATKQLNNTQTSLESIEKAPVNHVGYVKLR